MFDFTLALKVSLCGPTTFRNFSPIDVTPFMYSLLMVHPSALPASLNSSESQSPHLHPLTGSCGGQNTLRLGNNWIGKLTLVGRSHVSLDGIEIHGPVRCFYPGPANYGILRELISPM